MAHPMRFPALILAAALAAGCVHKIDVEQGNYLTQDVVDKLKPGMTRAQVRALLGTPLLTDIFHADRWDYYFDNAKSGKQVGHKRLTVFFKGDTLASFTGDANPPLPPATRPQTPPPAPPSAK